MLMGSMPAGRGADQASSPEDLQAALRVVEAVAASEDGQPFSMPVTEQEAPGYSDYIRSPMDLGTIAGWLKDGHYISCGTDELHGRSAISHSFSTRQQLGSIENR